jgi:PAS domain S-box-containing protein
MSWHWSGTSLLLLAGAGYLTACAVYVWRYRRGPTAASLVVVLAALAQWGVARAGALAAGDPAIKRVFCDLKYVGLVVLAPAAIVFVLQHAGRLRRPSPLLLGLLAVEPLVILLALAIPSTRHLFQTCLPSIAPDAAPMVRYGPLFWVHFVYFNAATWLCLAAFVVTMARTSRPYRRQNAILLGSLALPLGANLLTLLNFGPFGWVDLPPFAFLLTVVFLGLAVFRFHLLDLRPIARSRIFQTIGEGVVVLDLGGKVIEANLAAERLLGQPVARTVAQPAQRLAPAWAELVRRQRGNGGEAVDEIADNGHIHEVTVSSLTDHLGWPTGQLVVARDVTERRRAEAAAARQPGARKGLLPATARQPGARAGLIPAAARAGPDEEHLPAGGLARPAHAAGLGAGDRRHPPAPPAGAGRGRCGRPAPAAQQERSQDGPPLE